MRIKIGIKVIIQAISIVSVILWPSISNARMTIEKAYVVYQFNGGASDCNISETSTMAAVESVLRQSRIKIVGKSDINDALLVIMNIFTYKAGQNNCAVNFNVIFGIANNTRFPGSKKMVPTITSFCNNNQNGLLANNNMADVSVNTFRRLTEECISAVEKLDE